MKRLALTLLLLLCGAVDVYSMPPAAKVLQGGASLSALRAKVKALNPVLWLDSDATTITQSNGLISAWADKSGNGYNFAQAADANKFYWTRADSLENRYIYSDDVTGAGGGWGANGLSARTASRITEDSSTSSHRVSQNPVEVVKGVSYTFSAIGKSADRFLVLTTDGGTPFSSTFFNLVNGTLGTRSANHTSSTITDLGGGYYKCELTFTGITSSASASHYVGLGSADTVASYTGNGTSYADISNIHFARAGKGFIQTTSYRIYAGLNGRAVVYAPAMASNMTRAVTAALDVTQGSGSYFFVAGSDGGPDSSNNKYIFGNENFNASGMDYWLTVNGYGNVRTNQAGANTQVTGNTAITAGATALLSFIKTGTSGQHYRNGSADNAAGTSSNSVAATATYLLGHTSQGMVGYLPELIVFNRALSLSEKATVDKYLGTAWPVDMN